MNLGIEESNLIAEKMLIEQQEKIEIKENLYNFFKRFMDIIGATVGVILLIPITIIIYILKKVHKEEGPIFYEQLRIGKGGKQFRIYKYRTMVMNADEKLWEYLNSNEEAKKEYEKYKKLKDDPRITPVGKILRKTSLDEFPQFINVLKGEMSMVGPRPYLHREIKDMGDNYNKIISVKPGITGYWQVNGRSEIDFKQRTDMDVAYINDKNTWFDIKLVIKTVLKIFKKDGAI